MKYIIPVTVGGATLGQLLTFTTGLLLFVDDADWGAVLTSPFSACLSLAVAWVAPVVAFALAWRHARYPHRERAVFFMAVMLPLVLGGIGGVLAAFAAYFQNLFVLTNLYLLLSAVIAPLFATALTFVWIKTE